MNVYSPSPAVEPEMTPHHGGPSGQWMTAIAGKLDLRRLWNIFRRRLGLFGAVAAAILLSTLLLTLWMTPKYTATANVLIDQRKEHVTNTEDVLSGLPSDTEVVDTEVEVLKSRQLAERVVAALNLEADPEFNWKIRQPTGLGVVLAPIEHLFDDPEEVKRSPLAVQKNHEAVIDHVLKRLTIKRTGLTYIIDVSFESESPAKAASIANKFADLYLTEQLETKFEATQQANNWLNDRLGQLRSQVLADDAAVQQYKIANNLLSADGTNLTEQEISNFNQSLAQARAQVAEDEARLTTAKDQLAHGSNGGDVGEALDSVVIQQLRQQRAQVSQTVADLQGRYGDRHPEMLKAKRQLSDIDGQIQAEIQRIISNLQAKVEVSRQRAAAIAGSLGGAKGALATNNRAMVRLNELQRAADASRTLYESYLNRYKETTTQQGIEQSDARVVSRAKIPTEPSSPKIVLNLVLGLFLALGAGVGGIGIAETLDAGLATADDVERRLDTAYLGAVPYFASVVEEIDIAPIDYVVAKPLSSFAEAFRALRTSISHSRLGHPVKVVAITSSLPGEGKTTTSVALARVAAMQGSRVIVVDCDLRRRTVNRLLGEEPSVGLLEVLSGEVPLEKAVVLDKDSGAHVLPLAHHAYTPKDVFGTAAMDRLLATLRANYDLVILDTAPVLPVADTRVLAPKADVLVFLGRWRRTPQHAIEAGLRLFQGTGTHIAGVCLTQMNMKEQSKYGYGDPGYYYTEYKKYYVN